MAKIGYARVSTGDQCADSQVDALREAGCAPDDIYVDQGQSGKKASRPELDKCLAFLRPGDALVITRLDRLGRSVQNLVQVVNDLHERGVDFEVTEQDINTASKTGKLLFHIMASVAEFESDLIKERTLDGLAAARARGVKLGGRQVKLSDSQISQARDLQATHRYSMADIAATVGCSRATLYRSLARLPEAE